MATKLSSSKSATEMATTAVRPDWQHIAGLDTSMSMWGDLGKNWQAIAAEMTDYSKRVFADGQETMQKLCSARTLDQAVEIQSGFARRSFDDYMKQMARVGTMYTDLAKETGKSVERQTQPSA